MTMLIKSQTDERYINSEYISSTCFNFDWDHTQGYIDIGVFFEDVKSGYCKVSSPITAHVEISVKLISGELYCIYHEIDEISSVKEYKAFVDKHREVYENLITAIAYSEKERIYSLEESTYC